MAKTLNPVPPAELSPGLEALNAKLDAIQENLKLMARIRGERLTRQDMAERLRISTKTLLKYQRAKMVPKPDATGHWHLDDVIAWEAQQLRRK